MKKKKELFRLSGFFEVQKDDKVVKVEIPKKGFCYESLEKLESDFYTLTNLANFRSYPIKKKNLKCEVIYGE